MGICRKYRIPRVKGICIHTLKAVCGIKKILMRMDATSPPKWSRQAEPTVIEWVDTSKCHKHVLNTRCSQVGNTTDNRNIKFKFNSSLVFRSWGFRQILNKKRFRYVIFGICNCHALVPVLHHPQFLNTWDLLQNVMNYKDQTLDNQGSLSGFWIATSYKHMTVVALFPTLTLWYLSIKVLASSEKKKKKKKDYLRRVWMFMTQAGFFCHKNADKEPCASTECQSSPSIPSAFEAFKQQCYSQSTKKRQEHTPTQLGNRSSFISEYNWSIMHLHYSLKKFRSEVFWISVELAVVQSLQWTQKPSKLHTLARCYKINKFAQIHDRSLLKVQLLLWWIEGPLPPKCLIADMLVTFTQVRERPRKLSLHKYKSQNKCQDKVFRVFQKSICIRLKGFFSCSKIAF